MYKRGDLQLTDPPCQDMVDNCDGNCDSWPEYGHNHILRDARSDQVFFYRPCAYLPHSCQEWVIGGPEQMVALIEDLKEALRRVSND